MSVSQCARCGGEIAAEAVQFKGKNFCSDECCEEFSDELDKNGELDLEDIAADFTDEDIEDVDLEVAEVVDSAGDFGDDDFDADF